MTELVQTSKTMDSLGSAASSRQLGNVASLFAHVDDDWCTENTKKFNEVYLWTNGDITEDQAVTKSECDSVEIIPGVRQIFERAASSLQAATGQPLPASILEPVNVDSSHSLVQEGQNKIEVNVLDLCCGQGRHTIELARRHPAVRFQGVDQCTFLLKTAAERAKAQCLDNVDFILTDARNLPVASGSFEIVLVMGNSFGYHRPGDNQLIMDEIGRVLKPGGVLVMDIMDARWTRDNYSPSGWEWIGEQFAPADSKLIACRERELSTDKQRLACREIVIDIIKGKVVQDVFYAVQLYDEVELRHVMSHSGVELQWRRRKTLSTPEIGGAADSTLMKRRHLLTATKPRSNISSRAYGNTSLYVHPRLEMTHMPDKGHGFVASVAIPAGTVVMAAPPYALVPTKSELRTICSNICCTRIVANDYHTKIGFIENYPFPLVAWCSADCEAVDRPRFELERAWLVHSTKTFMSHEKESDIAMIWLVLRLFCQREVDLARPDGEYSEHNWEYVMDCVANLDSWPQQRVQHWKELVQRYIPTKLLESLKATPEEFLELLGQEQSNSFGLYEEDSPDPKAPRGKCYAVGFYPRASHFNHSCDPNVSCQEQKANREGSSTKSHLDIE